MLFLSAGATQYFQLALFNIIVIFLSAGAVQYYSEFLLKNYTQSLAVETANCSQCNLLSF